MLNSAFFILFSLGFTAQAVRTLTCEVVKIKYTQKIETITDSVDLKPVFLRADGQENVIEKSKMLVMTVSEDPYLKGLFFAQLTQGHSALSSDEGMTLSVFIKKDQILSAEFFQDKMLTQLALRPREKVQGYLVGTGPNFNSLAKLRVVNKLRKDLLAEHYFMPSDLDFNAAMSMLLDSRFQDLLLKLRYLPGETLFVGLNSYCLEGSH